MNQMMNKRMKTAKVLLAAGLLLANCGIASAKRIVLGDAAGLAVDQPRVVFGLYDDNEELVGPTLYNLALLDTGANGVLLGRNSFVDLDGGSGEKYEQAVHGGKPVVYMETGVGDKPEALKVYRRYKLAYNGYGDDDLQVINGVRPFGSPFTNLGSFAAILGMPAMMEKHVRVDLTALRGNGIEEIDYIKTRISRGRIGTGRMVFEGAFEAGEDSVYRASA